MIALFLKNEEVDNFLKIISKVNKRKTCYKKGYNAQHSINCQNNMHLLSSCNTCSGPITELQNAKNSCINLNIIEHLMCY